MVRYAIVSLVAMVVSAIGGGYLGGHLGLVGIPLAFLFGFGIGRLARRWFLVLFLLLPLPAMGQQVIPAPAMADSAWKLVLACTGAKVQPGGDLKDVVWTVDSVQAADRFHETIAYWLPPDTIRLDPSVAKSLWVIEHELIHHILRGPPGIEKHPFNPFYFPCKAMPRQHEEDIT